MLSVLLLLAVRPELAQGQVPRVPAKRPSTSSGRTEEAARAASPALDAERAFAADAQAIGQWAAFRKWAAADAVLFAPQPTGAQAWLKDHAEPAKAVEWWPTASWVSCDGMTAVNTGGSRWPDGSVGYFTTVWQRQADGSWRWLVDGGDTIRQARARVAHPRVRRASCAGRPTPGWPPVADAEFAQGGSADRTLNWYWLVEPDGTRTFVAAVWNGSRQDTVINDHVVATP